MKCEECALEIYLPRRGAFALSGSVSTRAVTVSIVSFARCSRCAHWTPVQTTAMCDVDDPGAAMTGQVPLGQSAMDELRLQIVEER